MKKKWYHSKTLWVNFLMAAALFVDANKDTLPFTPETEIYIVLGINTLLRLITTKPLTK